MGEATVPASPDTESEKLIEKLSADLVEAYETLTLMYRTVSNLGGLFRLEDITAYLLNRSLEASASSSGVLYLHDLDGGYTVAAESGDLVARLVSDAAERCVQFGRPLFLHGPIAGDFARPGERAIFNLLCAPLETGGRTLGVLIVERGEGEQYTTSESKLVGALCGLSAVAIANFQHYRAVNYEREMLEGVVREIGDGIVVTDEAWATRMTNQAARGFLAVSETEPEGFDALGRLSAYKLSVSSDMLRTGGDAVSEFVATSRDPRRPLVLACKVLSARLGTASIRIRILCIRDVTREHMEAVAQRDFLSVASHKLRTPLTKVLGLLPIARDDEAGEELKEAAFEGIESGANDLRQLVDGVLQFVEFRQGQRVVRRVELPDVLSEAVEAVRETRRDRHIDLHAEITGEPFVHGSWQMMRTMLEHLIDNAVKFTPSQTAYVGVTLAAVGEELVRITVADHGDGIAPELLAQLFQPFSQRDEEFTGQSDGAGLGLMLVRQAVEKHGGRLSARSTLGAGSTFTVELPVRFEDELQ